MKDQTFSHMRRMAFQNPCFHAEETRNPDFHHLLNGYSAGLTVNIGLE